MYLVDEVPAVVPEAYDPWRHNYVKKQQRLIAEGQLHFEPGRVYEVQVRHEDWCAMLVQNQYCDCDPIITLVDHDATSKENDRA